jgi:hypothetical protein
MQAGTFLNVKGRSISCPHAPSFCHCAAGINPNLLLQQQPALSSEGPTFASSGYKPELAKAAYG